MTIEDKVAIGIARIESLASEIFEIIEGIHDACTACGSLVSVPKPTLMEVNKKFQQYTNTQTKHKMNYATKSAATLSERTEKKD